MSERIITVSRESEPSEYEGVWIQVKEEKKIADYIKAAIRMAPDKLVITKDCIGLFTIHQNTKYAR